MFLAFQTVFLPGMIIGMLNNRGYMPRSMLLRSATEITLLAVILGVGLPASIALFSREGSIKRDSLEKDLRDRIPQNISRVNFYRGL